MSHVEESKKSGWGDIIDEPQKGAIPESLSLTVIEARDIFKRVSPQVRARLAATSPALDCLMTAIQVVAGLDPCGEPVSKAIDLTDVLLNPGPADKVTRAQLAIKAVYEANHERSRCIIAQARLTFAEESRHNPNVASRDLTSFYNAITEVMDKEKSRCGIGA